MYNDSARIFLVRSFGAGTQLLVAILVARVLTVECYGIYAQMLSGIGLLSLLFAAGTPLLLTREIAALSTRERCSEIKALMHWAWRRVVIVASCGSIGISVATILLLSGETRSFVLISVAIALIMTGNLLRAGCLRGLHRVVAADLPDSLLLPLCLITAVSTGSALAGELQLETVLMMQAFAALSASLFGAVTLRRTWPNRYRMATRALPQSHWNRASVTFTVTSLLSAADLHINVLLVGALADTVEAGLFQASSKVVSVVAFGLATVNSAILPKISAAWSVGDSQSLRRWVRSATRAGVACAILISLPLTFVPEPFLSSFGPHFAAAEPVLRILIAGQLINAFCGPCGIVLAMTGHQRYVLYAQLFALTLTLILNVLLTKSYGAFGGAVAASASFATWNLLMTYWVYKHAKGLRTYSLF